MNPKGVEAFQAAIKFEEDGRAYFLAASEKTTERFGKFIFLDLADAELNHIDRIKEIYGSLDKMGEWPNTPPLFTAKHPAKNIFEEALEKIDRNVKPTTGELEAVTLGIQYEEKGMKLYADLAEEASHPLEKKFYDNIGLEEQRHMTLS